MNDVSTVQLNVVENVSSYGLCKGPFINNVRANGAFLDPLPPSFFYKLY